MADRLPRFQHLERPRRDDGEAAPAPSAASARFEEVGGPEGAERGRRATSTSTSTPTSTPTSHPTSTSHPTPTADRFRDPPPASGLDLDLAPGDEQPFRRCCRCEADAGRFARACSNCGADLLTDEQRVFNERLWEERRREAADEERENAARREAAQRDEEETAKARRAAAEALAREVGQRERRRLDRDAWRDGPFGGGGPDWTGGDVRPIGLRLLSLIRDARWRFGVIAALLLAALAAVVYALARRQPAAVVLVALVLSILFSPPRSRWRRRWWE